MENNFVYGSVNINYIPWYQVWIQYLYFMPQKYNSNIIIQFDRKIKTYISNIFINNYDIIDENKTDIGSPNLIDQGTTLIMFKKNRCETDVNLNKEFSNIFKENIIYEKSIYTSIYFIYDLDNPGKDINVFALFKDKNGYRFAYDPQYLEENTVKDIIMNMFEN